MRVRAIVRHVPGIGAYGAERNIDTRSAKVLMKLGKVDLVEPEPTKPRRTYKRRDMVAEPVYPVVEIEDPPEEPPDESE